MQGLRVMIDRDADGKALIVEFIQDAERWPVMLHRLHRIGEDNDVKPARQSLFEHGHEVWIHERLSAGEADFARWKFVALDLVVIKPRIGCGKIRQPVVAGARFNVAIHARQIAERASVDPQRLQRVERNAGARVAAGGARGILELHRRKRLRRRPFRPLHALRLIRAPLQRGADKRFASGFQLVLGQHVA